MNENISELVMAGKAVVLNRLERLSSYKCESPAEEERRLVGLEEAAEAWYIITNDHYNEPEPSSPLAWVVLGVSIGAVGQLLVMAVTLKVAYGI
jgi:hypothetical protein